MIEDVQRAVDEAVLPSPPLSASAPVQVIPAARRLGRANGIDLDQVRGSGSGGRVTVEDVQRVIDASAQPATVPLWS